MNAHTQSTDRDVSLSGLRGSAIRVAFVSQPFDLVYPPEVDSSVPLQTVNLAQELAGRGFFVSVYAPRKNESLIHCAVNDVQYTYISERGSGLANRTFARLLSLFPGRRLPFHASRLSELRYIVEVAARIRASKADIVHVHSFTNFIPVIRFLNPRVAIVLHMHSEWVTQMNPVIMRRRVAKADLLLACSTYFARTVQAAFPDSEAKLRTLYNGVDTTSFSPAIRENHPPSGSLCILFVGRVSPEKGIHTLLDAFADIADDFPEVELKIVGPDASAPRHYIVDASTDPHVRALSSFYDIEERVGVSYMNQMKARLSPQLANRVHFLGPSSRNEVIAHYRSSDVLVNPSLSEMFGGTVAEAMACGLPVIASRLGGMMDTVLHQETGVLIEPGRTDELVGALRLLLTDARLRREMGRRARERAVALVSWNRLGEQLATEYASLAPEVWNRTTRQL